MESGSFVYDANRPAILIWNMVELCMDSTGRSGFEVMKWGVHLYSQIRGSGFLQCIEAWKIRLEDLQST